MDLNDLFVSYKQVNTPSYLSQESYLQEEPQSIIDQTNLDRIQSRKQNIEQSNEGFPGWIYPSSTESVKPSHFSAKGSQSFNRAMDSYLSKHPEDAKYRQTLTEIAAKESNFNPTAKNAKSSACGYFQFINSTRKQYAPHLTREQFLNNPEEQITAAVKLLKANRNISSKFSNLRGLSQLQIDYGMWFSPKALTNYLKTGNSNFKDAQGTSLIRALNKMA